MAQAYSDPSREDDAFALPDIEVFYMTDVEVAESDCFEDIEVADRAGGWFYWSCLPGCLPDSDPCGPYATEAEALKAAQDDAAEF